MISTISALGTGTLPQWGTFVSLLVIIAGVATVFIRGIPARVLAKSNAKHIENTDYAQQIKEFRLEVHGYRNDLAKLEARLILSESQSRRRSDRIKNMMFVLRLLMSELRRLDPKSLILEQAELMLSQMESEEGDEGKTQALRAAENTLHSAERTVAAVHVAEDSK